MADTEEGTWLTPEAYERLTSELEYLKGPWRREIAKRIEEARAEGDLRENGGYQAAKDEQGVQEGRIRQIEALLENAKVGEATLEDGKIGRGTFLTVKLGSKELSFLIGNREIAAGQDIHVYSDDSPLGAAVMGHTVGDKVSYTAPTGRTINVEILDAKPYQG
ncbi:MAG: transcription elongation factor GreA [Microbacteriaceae bacterium]|jgi:transcription elongation factor GreA|nr:transcription elongation factor GreA [Microbacteriaceae bacterium]